MSSAPSTSAIGDSFKWHAFNSNGEPMLSFDLKDLFLPNFFSYIHAEDIPVLYQDQTKGLGIEFLNHPTPQTFADIQWNTSLKAFGSVRALVNVLARAHFIHPETSEPTALFIAGNEGEISPDKNIEPSTFTASCLLSETQNPSQEVEHIFPLPPIQFFDAVEKKNSIPSGVIAEACSEITEGKHAIPWKIFKQTIFSNKCVMDPNSRNIRFYIPFSNDNNPPSETEKQIIGKVIDAWKKAFDTRYPTDEASPTPATIHWREAFEARQRKDSDRSQVFIASASGLENILNLIGQLKNMAASGHFDSQPPQTTD